MQALEWNISAMLATGFGRYPMSDLIDLATDELERLGLAPRASVMDGTVIRQLKAYPVYDENYGEALKVIQRWLDGLENFQTAGRNGLHRYNNQDHSMLTAMLAVQNLAGRKYNLWDVNVERSYHEQFTVNVHRKRQSSRYEPARYQSVLPSSCPPTTPPEQLLIVFRPF